MDISISKDKVKTNSKGKDKKLKNPKKTIPVQNKKKRPRKQKVNAFIVESKGHWKNNCPYYLAQKKEEKGNVSFLVTCN